MLHKHPGGSKLSARLLSYCAFTPQEKVLDIGCGTGTTVAYLQQSLNVKAIGIDTSPTRLAEGRKKFPTLSLLAADAMQLPFANAAFSGVVAECSLSLMPDKNAVLSEISRVLTAGGKLAITDIYFPAIHSQNNNQLQEMLLEHKLITTIWEDHSACLREFIATYIMQYGSSEELCAYNAKSTGKIGYFLMVAKKQAEKEG